MISFWKLYPWEHWSSIFLLFRITWFDSSPWCQGSFGTASPSLSCAHWHMGMHKYKMFLISGSLLSKTPVLPGTALIVSSCSLSAAAHLYCNTLHTADTEWEKNKRGGGGGIYYIYMFPCNGNFSFLTYRNTVARRHCMYKIFLYWKEPFFLASLSPVSSESI